MSWYFVSSVAWNREQSWYPHQLHQLHLRFWKEVVKEFLAVYFQAWPVGLELGSNANRWFKLIEPYLKWRKCFGNESASHMRASMSNTCKCKVPYSNIQAQDMYIIIYIFILYCIFFIITYMRYAFTEWFNSFSWRSWQGNVAKSRWSSARRVPQKWITKSFSRRAIGETSWDLR